MKTKYNFDIHQKDRFLLIK